MNDSKRGRDHALLARLAGIRESALSRATNLREHAKPSTQAELLWMSTALQELDVAHEELRVVEDELHTQADALTRVRAELELESGRYRELFELAPDPYLVTDSAGLVLQANQRACELFDIVPRFLVGKPLGLFIGDDDRQLLRNVLGLLTSATETMTFDLHVRPRHGTHSISTRASVRRAAGKHEPVQTLRWILHRPHGGSSSQLEPPDERRERLERALEDERRRRADTEVALQRRNGVLAFVAHELRNPLGVATGWLEILKREESAQVSQKQAFLVLDRNIKALSRMIEELVDETRVVEDRITLEYEQTDTRALLERVCADALGQAETKRQRFGCELAADLGSLYCDPFRVQQALNNVIGNALKFTPAGGVVQLSARVIGETLEVAVHDSGPGIAAQHLRSIFEPFTRLNAEGGSTGLGLGLSIARRLIELHAGKITAESEGVDRGATFRVQLPLGPRG